MQPPIQLPSFPLDIDFDPSTVSEQPEEAMYVMLRTYFLTFGSGTRILFEVVNWDFAVGKLEPFFCTLSIWDVSKDLKVSEDFHFGLFEGNLPLTAAEKVNEVLRFSIFHQNCQAIA